MNWRIFELLLNLYEGILYTWFITKMLSRKAVARWPFVSCALLTAFGFSTYLIWPMPSSDTWVFIFIIVYSLLFLKGSFPKKDFLGSDPYRHNLRNNRYPLPDVPPDLRCGYG